MSYEVRDLPYAQEQERAFKALTRADLVAVGVDPWVRMVRVDGVGASMKFLQRVVQRWVEMDGADQRALWRLYREAEKLWDASAKT